MVKLFEKPRGWKKR